MKNEVLLLGAICKLEFAYYPNDTIAITAIQIVDDEEWCTPTVNYERFYQGLDYPKELAFPVVVIKNYSENQGVYEDLVKAGVIQSGPYIAGTNGMVIAGLLTEPWQALAKAQLEKIRQS